MPLLLLVRHAQASAEATDYDVLSERGREQGLVLAGELHRRALRDPVVVSGSLRRQRDTAALALPGTPAVIDERWDEYDHELLLQRHLETVGPEAGGTAPTDFQGLLDQVLTSWIGAAEPDGWTAFRGRVLSALDDLLASLPAGRDAVVFTSAGVIAAVTTELLGAGPTTFVALNRVGINGAITKVTGGRSLLAFNDHSHFDAHLDGDGSSLLTYR